MQRAGPAAATELPPWHCIGRETLGARLGTSLSDGLTEADAQARTRRFGPNAFASDRGRGLGRILAGQFADLMVIVLFAAALVAGLVGELSDTITIAVIVLINVVIGTVQELRAEHALAALRQLAAPNARVTRSGRRQAIAAAALVPGDLVALAAGDVVPADIRLVDSRELLLDEASLTGESEPVDKHPGWLGAPETVLAERCNMVYRATAVLRGDATGVVVAIGPDTEVGRIASLLRQTQRTRTPLQRRLAGFARWVVAAIAAVCLLVFAIGMAQGEAAGPMFLLAVSLAVAAVPESLPAVVAISLALGARRLAERHSLARRLAAVEALGSVTCICSDKTGTLTENQMRVAQFVSGGTTATTLAALDAAQARCFARAMVLCSDAGRHSAGDPTEIALLEAAAEAGFDATTLLAAEPPLAVFPFDPVLKRMTSVHPQGARFAAWTKGAPEAVLECAGTAPGGAALDRAGWLARAADLADSGYRVLALAMREWPARPVLDGRADIERDMVFLGLVALQDPVRAEVPAAIAACRAAGIRVVMITGDHPRTARSIAARIGIGGGDEPVLNGAEIAALDDAALAGRVGAAAVCARVDPAQKIRIVRALQSRGELVAMTGDGVNDAPALRQADIGVAMGRRGTEVARETADLVLLDDNFTTIVAAIAEGRRIYANIRKFIRYTLTSNTGEIAVLLAAPLVGLPVPLQAVHVLWINLVTDGLPGLMFALEPGEPALMRQPPRPPAEGVLARGLGRQMLAAGSLLALLALLPAAWVDSGAGSSWQSMVFTTVVFGQLMQALSLRSETRSILDLGLRGNPALLGAIAAAVMLQLCVLYLPVLNTLLHTVPLAAGELASCVALSLLMLPFTEWQKRRQ